MKNKVLCNKVIYNVEKKTFTLLLFLRDKTR